MRAPRSLIVGIAAGLLVLGSGAVWYETRHGGSAPDTLAQDRPTPAPTAEPSVVATPTRSSAPPPTTMPRVEAPRPSASSTSPAVEGDLGPASPGSVSFPYREGQHTWSGTSEGISMRVSISPNSPKVGEPVTFTVAMSGADDDCCALYVVYGDGAVTPGVDCPLPSTGGSVTRKVTHTYNKSGHHRLLVQAISHCDRNGVFYLTIDVGPGSSTPQGPSVPVLRFSQSQPAQDPTYHTVTLYGDATDEDGWVTKLVVDFGDGTSKVFPGDRDGCRPSRDGWPLTSTAMLPQEPPYAHKYARSGSFTLRLMAYSAGCDGTDVQHGSASFTFTIEPEPTQPPSPTPSPSPNPTPPAVRSHRR